MASTSRSKRKTEIAPVSPVTVLKRRKDEADTVTELSDDVCLFCQAEEPSDLSSATDEGRSRVLKVALERQMLNDIKSNKF